MAKDVAAKPENTKPEGTAVVTWQDELKALAVKTAEAEKPAGDWFSFKSGVMSLGGNPIKDNKAKVIILHSVFENAWYKDRYDSNNPQPPHCFALGDTDDDLRPHADSALPQSETCDTCPKNAWGSDPGGGKGKACKNGRRLAMISENDLNIIPKAVVAMAKMPVTSVKNWSTFASQIASVLKLPPIAVIAEMSCTSDPKTIFQVNFELVDKVPEDKIPELLARRRDTVQLVFAPYAKPTEPTAQQQQRKF